MWKKTMVLTVLAVFLFAPLAGAAQSTWNGSFWDIFGKSNSSSQMHDRDMYQGRDMDRGNSHVYDFDRDRVYPEKSPFGNERYDRQLGDIGSATRPTLRGGEGSR